MRHEVLLQFLHLMPNGFSHVTTVTMAFLANNYSVAYLPVEYSERSGRSKFHWFADTQRYVTQVTRMIMLYQPLRIFLPAALLLLAVGVGKLIYDVVAKDFAVAINTVVLLASAVSLFIIGLLADLIVQVSKSDQHVDPVAFAVLTSPRVRRHVPIAMQRARAGVTTPLAPNARLRFDALARCLDEVGASGSFLEVGCGQGAAATVLAGRFDYVGYEPDPTSYETARRRLVEGGRRDRVQRDAAARPRPCLRRGGAFEVLEHIEDDHMAAAGWVRWLRPGGHLVISVPAHPERFASADVVAGHFRRYTRESLTEVLETAGLVDVEAVVYGWSPGTS